MKKMRNRSFKAFFMASAAAFGLVFTAGVPTSALAQQQCSEDDGPSKTLTQRIGLKIQEIYPLIQEEQFGPAIAQLDELIAQRGGSMSGYDRATVLELRGSSKAGVENFRGALQDFQAALDTGELSQSRNNQLRYFIAQLNFQEERYQTAINGLNQWIAFAKSCGQPVDASAYYLLAAAYSQTSPPNYRAAVSPGENAIAAAASPNKSYYDLLNLIYSELNNGAKRRPLLERMVNNWPSDKSYWTQLSGAYSVAGQDKDAFSVLEVAYRAGLLDKDSELLTLIQYYSFFDNPYRGATLLEREMNAGNIPRVQKNLILLSQLWSQSREHKKSIPILREAASGADNGELYYRLGQVLLADEQYASAQTALQNALNRGGMNAKNTGDAWLLLGTARFSQAGPEDTGIWVSARQAFVNAQRYQNVSQRASQWVSYIDAVASTYRAGIELEKQQNIERCTEELRRTDQNERIESLQNITPSPEELERRVTLRAECAELLKSDEEAEDSDAGDEGAEE